MMRPIFVALILALSVGISDAARTTYTFSISNDTSNGIVNPRVLQNAIIASAITTTPVHINTASGNIDIVMSSQLTGARATTLTNVVADHKGGTRKPTLIHIQGTAGDSITQNQDTLVDWGSSPGEVFDHNNEWSTNTFIPNLTAKYGHDIMLRMDNLADAEAFIIKLFTNGVAVVEVYVLAADNVDGVVQGGFSITLFHQAGDSVQVYIHQTDVQLRNIQSGVKWSWWDIEIK